MAIATLLIRVSTFFCPKKKNLIFYLENTSSRSHRDRRPSEKIVANREFFSIVNSLLNSIVAENF